MAKKKDTTEREITITVKDLAKALEGISVSVMAVRRLVLKLEPDTIIRIKTSKADPAPRFWDDGCPPPE